LASIITGVIKLFLGGVKAIIYKIGVVKATFKKGKLVILA
tara:strand:+ start:613 stop:732 length:120 start_codon:yes stop_codon:yes gene_type:complete